MKILITGKGGREHALAWKAAQSPLVSKIYVAPGSAGMTCNLPQVQRVPINDTDNAALVHFAKTEQVDLTLVGPENALVNGIVDDFRQEGLSIFGPCKAAAQLEGSKLFAKQLMDKYGIPTARYAVFSDYEQALSHVQREGVPIVIKYDGLAAGKGVVVAQTEEEAVLTLQAMLLHSRFGEAKVVIEEFLQGPEFSLMALVHGETVVPLSVAQDHKRAFDGDKGPNTGGMGAYCPVPIISQKTIEQAVKTILQPVATAMVAEGNPFTGILYGGLMLTNAGPKVIEFNVRFGDPETEVVLPRMKSDLIQTILDLLNGKKPILEWHEDVFLGVVLASAGYPEMATKGSPIEGLENVNNLVFHCGTENRDGQWLTNGGRVLFVTGKGKDVAAARENAYMAVEQIHCKDIFYRRDIGIQSL
ncbi:MAG: phosphoribosylamine--glycine ligase [Bacteroidales bacterium]|jgi:phosphoribosylamine--glycine ligase|nr:phosphoribosylamine--glycine ligase [Bacteroidales bacterium]